MKLALRRGEGSENEEYVDRMAQSLKEEPGEFSFESNDGKKMGHPGRRL